MSYCRKGLGSDLYVWSDGDHFFIQADSLSELRQLLEKLDAEGVKVPARAFARIDMELEEAAGRAKASEAITQTKSD